MVIVLRRISDYDYITAALQSPFTTRWGYGGRILDLNPGVLTGDNQLFNILSPSLIFKIIGYNFNTIPVPKSQEKELSCGQSFSSNVVQNITILYIFYQNFSGGGSPDPPPPPCIKYKSINPPNVTVKQSQKLTTKRCKAPHFSLLSPSFLFPFFS